jgi:hypothetical protein
MRPEYQDSSEGRGWVANAQSGGRPLQTQPSSAAFLPAPTRAGVLPLHECEAFLGGGDSPEPAHQTLKETLFRVVVAITDSHSTRMPPDLGPTCPVRPAQRSSDLWAWTSAAAAPHGMSAPSAGVGMRARFHGGGSGFPNRIRVRPEGCPLIPTLPLLPPFSSSWP